MDQEQTFQNLKNEKLKVFGKILDGEYETYEKKVKTLENLKIMYKSPIIYNILGIVFFILGIFIIIYTYLKDLNLSLFFKVIIILLVFLSSFTFFHIARKMWFFKKIFGKEYNLLKRRLSKEIKDMEKNLYEKIQSKTEDLVIIIKEDLKKNNVSQDLIDLFIWNFKNDLKKEFLKGPNRKKLLFLKISKKSLT